MKIVDIYKNIKDKIFTIGKKSEPEWCKECQRTKEKAIQEQLEIGHVCSSNKCAYKQEIENRIKTKSPELILFSTDKNQILKGDSIRVEWNVKFAKRCLLQSKVVSNIDYLIIQPLESQKIFLEVESYNGTFYHDDILITVYSPPELSINISNSEIIKGSEVRLSWIAKNCLHVSFLLDNVEHKVNSNGYYVFKPLNDVDIGFTVLGYLESELKDSKSIKVFAPVEIIAFSANSDSFIENDIVVFTYEAANFTKALLTGPSINGSIDISDKKQIEIKCVIANNHTTKQTYYLEVFDKLNNPISKQSIDIIVYPQPQIEHFSISRNKILYGDEIEIRWIVKNYSKIILRTYKDEIEVFTMSSYKIKPQHTGEYKLVVESLGGLMNIESTELTLEIFYYVELDFSSDKNHTIQTVPVNLKWNVRHATEVYLEVRENTLNSNYSNRINVTNLNSIKVLPEKTSIYRLIACNELDKVEEEKQISVFELPKVDCFKLPHIPLINFNQEVSLNFDKPKRFVKIEKSLEDNNWFYQLFTWQPRDIGNWMVYQFESINKRIITLINTVK
jgi:hypothetical protein